MFEVLGKLASVRIFGAKFGVKFEIPPYIISVSYTTFDIPS